MSELKELFNRLKEQQREQKLNVTEECLHDLVFGIRDIAKETEKCLKENNLLGFFASFDKFFDLVSDAYWGIEAAKSCLEFLIEGKEVPDDAE